MPITFPSVGDLLDAYERLRSEGDSVMDQVIELLRDGHEASEMNANALRYGAQAIRGVLSLVEEPCEELEEAISDLEAGAEEAED